MTRAFYVPSAASFAATELTRGPWDPGHQHGGPPAALLGRAVERFEPVPGMRVVRMTLEILRPVPISELSVDVSLARPGKSVQLLEATLSAGGRAVMLARAWRMRTTALPLSAPRRNPLPAPESGTAEPFFSAASDVGYHSGTEWRFVRGSFREPGPGTAWIRMTAPLVEGETPSPLERVLTVADSGNGVSAALDHNRYVFVNTDLTVLLHREAEGEWIALDSETVVEPEGVGMTTTVLHDRRGPLGRALQTLFVAPR
jgi:hypothetical protein